MSLVPPTQESTREAHTRRVPGLLFCQPQPRAQGLCSLIEPSRGALAKSKNRCHWVSVCWSDAMEVSPVAVPSKMRPNLNELGATDARFDAHEAHTQRVRGLLFVDPSKGSGVVSPH